MVIQDSHVPHFFGAHLGRMLNGFPLIQWSWSKWELFNAIPMMKEAMMNHEMDDHHQCLHIVDDWDDNNWEVYNNCHFPVPEGTAHHCQKYGYLGEAHCRWWYQLVPLVRALTVNELRIIRWYNLSITINPEPKPI